VLLALRRGVDRLPARRVTPAVAARVGRTGSCGAHRSWCGPSCRRSRRLMRGPEASRRRRSSTRRPPRRAQPCRPSAPESRSASSSPRRRAAAGRTSPDHLGDRDADHDPGDDGMDPGRPAPLRCRPSRRALSRSAALAADSSSTSMRQPSTTTPGVRCPPSLAPATIAGAVRPRARRWMWTG